VIDMKVCFQTVIWIQMGFK